jgi:hypothetical protein
VNFRLKGIGNCEERILSRPFFVFSNRKKTVKGGTPVTHRNTVPKERPIVDSIKPDRGPSLGEYEAIIRGSGFHTKGKGN